MIYEFKVEDDNGLWGSVRVEARGRHVARQKASEFLKEEVEPNGSLLASFSLTLTNTDPLSTQKCVMIAHPARKRKI